MSAHPLPIGARVRTRCELGAGTGHEVERGRFSANVPAGSEGTVERHSYDKELFAEGWAYVRLDNGLICPVAPGHVEVIHETKAGGAS